MGSKKAPPNAGFLECGLEVRWEKVVRPKLRRVLNARPKVRGGWELRQDVRWGSNSVTSGFRKTLLAGWEEGLWGKEEWEWREQ